MCTVICFMDFMSDGSVHGNGDVVNVVGRGAMV